MAESNNKYKQDPILKLIQEHRESNAGDVADIHHNMFQTDLRYHRASVDYLRACQKAKEKAEAAGCCPDEIVENVQPPVLLEQTEGTVAYLASLFLARNPIYTPMAKPKLQEKTEPIEALMLSYQNEGQWVAEEIQALRNVVKHNITASICSWRSYKITEGVARTFSHAPDGLDLETISLYDCIWDTCVEPKNFQSEGMFFEYNKYLSNYNLSMSLDRIPTHHLLNETSLDKFIDELGAEKEHKVIRPMKAIESLTSFRSSMGKTSTDWAQELGLDKNDGTVSIGGDTKVKGYKLSTVYLRARDKDLGYDSSTSKRYNSYKILLVNDKVIAVEKLNMSYFEVILSTGIVDDFGYNTKSIVEPANLYQDVATSLIKAKLSASRRAQHDRAVFNPLFVKSSDVNDPNDALKIPIRKSQWWNPNALTQAYREIPYRDSNSRELLTDASLFMTDLPSRATGLSEFRRAPVRGNRSKGQFELESRAADGRGFLMALTLEASRFSKIRKIMRILLLTHTPLKDSIQWDELTDHLDFRITDGLVNLGIFEDVSTLETLLNTAAQNPTFAPLAGEILKHVLSVKTPFQVSDFAIEQITRGIANDQNANDNPDGRNGLGTNGEATSTGGALTGLNEEVLDADQTGGAS